MAEANEGEAPAKRRRLPLKTLLVLGAVMLMEIGTVAVVFAFVGRTPPVSAEGAVPDETRLLEELVELLAIDDKFSNQKRGETYIYSTEIYVTVRRKHQERVASELERMKARITTDVATVISRATPSHFAEPTLATLTRQVQEVMLRRIGSDPEDEEQPLVHEVLIKKCMPYKADA